MVGGAFKRSSKIADTLSPRVRMQTTIGYRLSYILLRLLLLRIANKLAIE